MSEIQSLPAALEHQAACDPESPFLFWPEGWNWRWWSWRQTAEMVARWTAPLAGLPPAAGVAFAGDSYPQAIALDLAVQSAGLTPVPLGLGGVGGVGGGAGGPEQGVESPRQAAARAGGVAWLEAIAGEARVTRLDESPAGAAPAAGVSGKVPAAPTGSIAGLAAGAAGMLVAAGSGAGRRLSQAELMAAVAQVERAIASPAGRRGDSRDRQILVAGGPLREWPGRLLAAWAVVAGAALVLETDPARRLGTVLWARPTVFHGTAAELAALRQQVETARWPRRWHRLRRLPAPPLGRLGTLFQSEALAAEEAAFWQQRGAQLLRLPALAQPGRGAAQS